MGLFSKKVCCSLCNEVKKCKDLSNGYICNDCISKCGVYVSFKWKRTSIEQAKDRINKNYEYEYLKSIFSATRKVEKYLEIDEDNKLLKIPCNFLSPILKFNDILDFELIENGNSISKGGLGSAVAGGILFGGVGAVVGGIVGSKKIIQEITEFSIKIITKDVYFPDVYINFLVARKLKSNSIVFKSYSTSAQSVLSLLTIVSSSNNIIDNTQPSYSSADEILKFKKLLDDGIITQEEFDRKKQQLLM